MIISGLISCTSLSGPIEIGPDTYVMDTGAKGANSSDAVLLTKAIKEAAAFCSSKNQRMDIQNIDTGGDQMATPHDNDVTFKCLPLNH